MAEGGQQSFLSRLKDDPAVRQLGKTAAGYITAKGEDMAKKHLPGPEEASGVIDAGKKQAKRDAIVPAAKGFFKGAWAKLTGKAKGSKGKRPINILETAMIGAPVEMVWGEWKDFAEWPNYMKGPESVKVDEGKDGEPATSTWTAKIFISRRQWKSTITEEVEYERLRWKSEARKGQIDGVVTFTPAGDNLTFCVLVLEYRPKGLFEQTGKIWRSQGRRARLDFKHFQRHVAMADQKRDDDEQPDEGRQRPDDEPEPDDRTDEPAQSDEPAGTDDQRRGGDEQRDDERGRGDDDTGSDEPADERERPTERVR